MSEYASSEVGEILLIGHSHTVAISSAIKAENINFIDVDHAIYVDENTGQKTKNIPGNYLSKFNPKLVFCSFGGSEHSVFGLLEAPVRFDFISRSIGSVDNDRWSIPHNAVRAALEKACRGPQRNMRVLREHFDCPIYHLCSPPPFLELGSGSVLPTAFRDRIHMGVSPARLRHKLYEVHVDIFRSMADEAGINFISTPKESMDEDGYLLPQYWSKEPTHGNKAYGELVLRQILSIYNKSLI